MEAFRGPGGSAEKADQKDHAAFTRRGEDLVTCMDVQLAEALCGFQKPVSTLDNRTIAITSHPGQIVKRGGVKCVLNEGMPVYRSPYEKGRQVIGFKVHFPENGFLSPDKLSLLGTLLPEREEVEETDEMDQGEPADFDPDQERRRHYAGEAYEVGERHPGVLFSVRPPHGATASNTLCWHFICSGDGAEDYNRDTLTTCYRLF